MIEIDNFLDDVSPSTIEEHYVLPKIKERIIQQPQNKIEFDKIFKLVSKDRRGGVLIENGKTYWNGFGLKRLKDFVDKSGNLNPKTVEFVNNKIFQIMNKFWEDYESDSKKDENIQSLDIRTVFADYLPDFEEILILNDCLV